MTVRQLKTRARRTDVFGLGLLEEVVPNVQCVLARALVARDLDVLGGKTAAHGTQLRQTCQRRSRRTDRDGSIRAGGGAEEVASSLRLLRRFLFAQLAL